MFTTRPAAAPAPGVAVVGAAIEPVQRDRLSTEDDRQLVLPDLVRRLAEYHVSSPALIVQTPEGEYRISPDGFGDGAQNRFVISRSELGALMWDHGLRRKNLSDPQTVAQVAALVAGFEPRRASGWWSV